jgi:hypothetical protein
MTQTRTRTSTYARTELLRVNLELVIARLLENAAGLIERILRPALNQQVIRSLEFFGFDDEHRCHIRLQLNIDWAEHKMQLETSPQARLDSRWQRGQAPEVRVLLQEFEKVVEERGLRVGAVMRLVPGPKPDWLRGLVRPGRRSPDWVEPPHSTKYSVRGLSELEVALELADDGREGSHQVLS